MTQTVSKNLTDSSVDDISTQVDFEHHFRDTALLAGASSATFLVVYLLLSLFGRPPGGVTLSFLWPVTSKTFWYTFLMIGFVLPAFYWIYASAGFSCGKKLSLTLRWLIRLLMISFPLSLLAPRIVYLHRADGQVWGITSMGRSIPLGDSVLVEQKGGNDSTWVSYEIITLYAVYSTLPGRVQDMPTLKELNLFFE